MFGGFSLLLWTGAFLCFLAYGIHVHYSEKTNKDNVSLLTSYRLVQSVAKSLKLPTAWNSQSLLVQIPKNSELSREVLDPSWSPATSYLGSFWFSSLGCIIPASHSHSVCDPFPLLSERQPLHLSPSLAHYPPPTFMGGGSHTFSGIFLTTHRNGSGFCY